MDLLTKGNSDENEELEFKSKQSRNIFPFSSEELLMRRFFNAAVGK